MSTTKIDLEICVKEDNPKFDVTLGDQSSTENCELITLFALHKVRYLPVSVTLY